jgi:hypothetical protein
MHMIIHKYKLILHTYIMCNYNLANMLLTGALISSNNIIRTSGSSKLISVPPTVDRLSNQIQSFVRVHVLYVDVPKNFQCLNLTNVFISSASLKKDPLIALSRTPRRFQWAPYPIQLYKIVRT